MYCDKAEQNQNGQLTINNPLLVINPVFVPGLFSFSVVFGVMGINFDFDHTVRLVFLDGEDNVIIDSNNISLPKGVIPDDAIGLPPEERGFMFNLDFRNVVFKTEGTYKTQVYIDGDLMGDYPIFVKAGGSK